MDPRPRARAGRPRARGGVESARPAPSLGTRAAVALGDGFRSPVPRVTRPPGHPDLRRRGDRTRRPVSAGPGPRCPILIAGRPARRDDPAVHRRCAGPSASLRQAAVDKGCGQLREGRPAPSNSFPQARRPLWKLGKHNDVIRPHLWIQVWRTVDNFIHSTIHNWGQPRRLGTRDVSSPSPLSTALGTPLIHRCA